MEVKYPTIILDTCFLGFRFIILKSFIELWGIDF